jgi:hypothetical protein
LGKGDCEGFLYRYLPKGTISFVQWRLYWCVLKGGTLYVFKSKEVSFRKKEKNESIVLFRIKIKKLKSNLKEKMFHQHRKEKNSK